MTDDAKLRTMVEEIHSAIVGSLDGTPGLIERVRILECFRDKFIKTTTGIRNYLIFNATTIGIAAILVYFKLK